MAAVSPPDVIVGQNWSIWSPARMHWLLGTVVRQKNGRAVLALDARYGIAAPDNELEVDERSILSDSNLFRFVPSASYMDILQETVSTDPPGLVAEADEVTALLSAGVERAGESDWKEMIRLGITRVPVDEYRFASFRYTNLKDAIAQAERSEELTKCAKISP